MKIKITENRLRALILQELKESIISEEEEATEEDASTAAGKKTEKLMDSSAMKPLQAALDKATTKEAVKETLSSLFSGLGENGQKFLKMALKELAAEI
jgi:hypothetical protein